VSGAADPTEFASMLGSGIAARLSAHLASDPGWSSAQQMAAIFDIGGCTNPDGSTAQAGDGVIDVCELVTNPIVRALFAPDVLLHDSAGHYAPGTGTPKDSVSLGVGFTATAASF
jgi:hypothetical protein